MTTPRLFPDFAAAPSARERAAARWSNGRNQGTLALELADLEAIAAGCPVCSSLDHAGADCPNGSALELELETPAPDPAAVRSMFRSLGWSVTE